MSLETADVGGRPPVTATRAHRRRVRYVDADPKRPARSMHASRIVFQHPVRICGAVAVHTKGVRGVAPGADLIIAVINGWMRVTPEAMAAAFGQHTA